MVPIPNLVGNSIFTLRLVHSGKAYSPNECEKQIATGACTHKGEEVIVSMSKPTLRAVLNGHMWHGPIVNKHHRDLSTYALNSNLQRPCMIDSF